MSLSLRIQAACSHVIAIANNHNLSPTEQYGLFDPNTMRPQSIKANCNCQAHACLMEDALPFASSGSTARNSTGLCVPFFTVPLFLHKSRTRLIRQVKKSMIRALSHSDADVAELSHRQCSLRTRSTTPCCFCVPVSDGSVHFVLMRSATAAATVRGAWDVGLFSTSRRGALYAALLEPCWCHDGERAQEATLFVSIVATSSIARKGAPSLVKFFCPRILGRAPLLTLLARKTCPLQYLTREGSRGGGFLLCEAERSISSLAGVAFSTQCH